MVAAGGNAVVSRSRSRSRSQDVQERSDTSTEPLLTSDGDPDLAPPTPPDSPLAIVAVEGRGSGSTGGGDDSKWQMARAVRCEAVRQYPDRVTICSIHKERARKTPRG